MTPEPPTKNRPKEPPKEWVTGLLIAFVVVLVFRGFFLESFHIPTGSMAPTLMGQHMRFHSPWTGFDWAVNPWHPVPGQGPPTNPQGTPRQGPIIVEDPSTRLAVSRTNVPLDSGDRIFTIKYNPLYHPSRYDVVVVKWPESPRENYIKRLVGMPGETLWLVDGDVFVAPPTDDDPASGAWSVARKPDHAQQAIWWPLFSSDAAPAERLIDGRAWLPPWEGEGWTLDSRTYTHESAAPSRLEWSTARWPITDFAPYNDMPIWRRTRDNFAIADLRLRAGVRPGAPGLSIAPTILARGHEFRASIDPSGSASLQMRRSGETAWRTLASAPVEPLHPDREADVEFWHADQSLQLRIDGRAVLRADYDWSPLERLALTTGLSAERLARMSAPDVGNPFADPSLYPQPRVFWEFSGAPVALHRVGLDRDLYYRPQEYFPGPLAGRAALSTHPASPVRLDHDQFFLLGDNSGNSRDGRTVDAVDPWVAATVDPKLGIVNRDMLMGRAFVVFWPDPAEIVLGPVRLPIVPDFGRMRWIR